MSDPFTDEYKLIDGCLAGRKDSWDAFVERFSKLIYWGIHRTLEGTPFRERADLCSDIFQELFERLVAKDELARLRDAKSVRKFLCVMACRETQDKVKALSRLEKRQVPGEEALVLPGDPSGAAQSRELNDAVCDVLEDLSPRERACVELCILDGKTHREAGETLGLPPDTVSTIVRRTKEKLKAKLTDKGITEF
ncbi:MAG: RNA polymerase sigma factor [Candidatus Omnitrophota bacterium]